LIHQSTNIAFSKKMQLTTLNILFTMSNSFLIKIVFSAEIVE